MACRSNAGDNPENNDDTPSAWAIANAVRNAPVPVIRLPSPANCIRVLVMSIGYVDDSATTAPAYVNAYRCQKFSFVFLPLVGAIK
mmetsp:Transcript_21822/g.32403  ORF Transcript_21822/g.32403 Transcript_21822/m.32403 type:complete len:86 (-) Transcript_21822:415-672(-)